MGYFRAMVSLPAVPFKSCISINLLMLSERCSAWLLLKLFRFFMPLHTCILHFVCLFVFFSENIPCINYSLTSFFWTTYVQVCILPEMIYCTWDFGYCITLLAWKMCIYFVTRKNSDICRPIRIRWRWAAHFLPRLWAFCFFFNPAVVTC